MSLHARFVVLSAALLARAMPLAIGFIVATLFGSKDYADTVLLITAANLCGVLPMLAVTPLVLRSKDDGMAVWLASRGILAGLPLILAGSLLVSRYLEPIGNGFFLFAYSSAVFVLGVAQSLHNQRMENAKALLHACAVVAVALVGGVVAYIAAGSRAVFLDALAAAMLAAALLSFASIRRRHARAHAAMPDAHPMAGLLDALWSGLFSLFVIGGLFLAGLKAKHAGDPAGYVAFSLGLQVFSVVVFIPGALSSYFIPRMVRSEIGTLRDDVAATVRAYAMIGALAFAGAMIISPLCFRYLQQPGEPRLFGIFALVQFAALLAAVNAAYNQVLVGLARFPMLALLSLLWLLVLLAGLSLGDDRGVWIAAALVAAYAVLVLASGYACRRAIATETVSAT